MVSICRGWCCWTHTGCLPGAVAPCLYLPASPALLLQGLKRDAERGVEGTSPTSPAESVWDCLLTGPPGPLRSPPPTMSADRGWSGVGEEGSLEASM